MGAVWALTGGNHDTTALCVRDSEFVRMSRVSAAPLLCSALSEGVGLLCKAWLKAHTLDAG